MSILGTRVIRTEDPRLLTSGGVYVDDLREPDLAGSVRATFVRSVVAHALITGIDTSAALAGPGAGGGGGGRRRCGGSPGGVSGGSRSRSCSPTATTRARTRPSWSAWTT